MALTPAEKFFIRKAYEDKTVGSSTLFQQAVEVAVGNVMRKKGKKPQKLWHKAQRPVDKEAAKKQIAIVEEIEKNTTKDWVRILYEGAGLRPPVGKE